LKSGRILPPPTETVQGMERMLDVKDDVKKGRISGKNIIAMM
jgi:hypothetical protein